MIQEFILYLKASGYTVTQKGVGSIAWSVTHGDGYSLTVWDTEEEQPEVLLWCLKELERLRPEWGGSLHRASHPAPSPDARYYYQYHFNGDDIWGPTMTAAAISAVCSLPEDMGVK